MYENIRVSIPPTCKLKVVACPRGGGGVTHIFCAYVRSGPASTVHPQNYEDFQAPNKYYPIFENPQNTEIPNFEPPKMARAYICMNISEYPPPPPPWAACLALRG